MIRTPLAFALPLLFVPSAAHASCDMWNVSGNALSIEQSNGPTVSFDLLQDGENLMGKAYSSAQPNAPGVVSDGRIRGSSLRLRVDWNSRSTGIYELMIDEDGRIEGYGYDFKQPTDRAQMIGNRRLTCRW